MKTLNSSKKQFALLLTVALVLVAVAYLYFNRGDFICCLVKEDRQRLCVRIDYIKENLNMSVKEWTEIVNCTSGTVRCKHDVETDEVVCRIPMERW